MVAPLASDARPAPRRRRSAATEPDPHGMRPWIQRIHPDPLGWYVIGRKYIDDPQWHFTPFQGHELDRAIAFIRKYRKACNLYMSMGSQGRRPMRGARGRSADVRTISCIWAEIDTREGVHAAENLPPAAQDALMLLSDLPPSSYTLHTGGGIQVEWFLEHPHSTMTTDVVAAIEAVQWSIQQKAAQYGWHVDMTSDAARVFRVPGTLNHKTEPAKEVRTLVQTDRTYTLDDFAEQLAAYNNDATAQQQRRAREQADKTATKYPSIAAYNDDHDIVVELERAGYIWEGRRMRHQDSDRAYSAGVIPDVGKNVAYVWDLQDPLHHNKGACACATPFQVHVMFDHHGDFGAAMASIRTLGWIDEAPYQMPVHTHIDTRYVSTAIHELPMARGVIIKSPINTGKTELLKRRIGVDDSVLVIGHRRNLLSNMAERLGLTYYEDVTKGVDEDYTDLTACTRLAICIDSLEKLSTRQQFQYVIIDESEQVLQHATGETMKLHRSGCLEYMQHFQRTGGQVLYLDADAGRITHSYAGRVLGLDNLHVIVNGHQPGDKTFIAYNTDTELKAALFAAIRQGQKVAVAANSIKTVKTLIQSIELEIPDVTTFAIHGDNSEDPVVKEFTRYINDRVKDVDVLVYSPSLGTGVSIDTVHFDTVFVFGHGQPTTHRDMLQQAGRVRNPRSGTVHVWVDSRRHDHPTSIDMLKEQCIRNATETGLLIGITAEGEMYSRDDDYLCLWADVESERHRSLNNLRDQFYAAVRADGHHVVIASKAEKEALDEARALYNAGRDAMFSAHVQQLRTVTPISGYEAKELRQKQTLTDEQKHQLQQYDLCLFYEVEPADITEALVKADEARLRRNAGRLAMLLHEDAARAADENERHALIPDKANHQVQNRLRRSILGHIQFLKPEDESVDVTTKALLNTEGSRIVTIGPSFAATISAQRAQLWSLLHLSVNRDIGKKPMQFVASFLAQLGLKMQSKQHRVDGKRVRTYFLDEEVAVEARKWADRWLELHPSTQQTELEVYDEAGY